MQEQLKHLQEDFLYHERESLRNLGGVHDPTLDTPLEDGRTLRQALYELSDHYREHIEQMLWVKWGQNIPRSEAKRALAELQGYRAQFAAYFSDLGDGHLDVPGDPAQKASARDVISHVLEEERKTLELIVKALEPIQT
ncbi:MAG: hypothetical protein HY680_01705 [Chloroflexi bacterium]|nr:hypothetical protein [Chloroflexota bacterium]